MAQKIVKCRILKDPESFAKSKSGLVIDVPEHLVAALVAVGQLEVVKAAARAPRKRR